MPENQNMSAPIELAEGFNPFSDDEQQVQPKVEGAPTQNEQQQAQPEQQQTQVQPEPKVEAQVVQNEEQKTFDPNQFIKERFGFESIEQAEQEFKKVKEFKEPEFEFQDDTSKSLFSAIKEGKTDEVFEILNQQKKLDKLTTAEIDVNVAADILKLSIQNKNKELTQEEVDFIFLDSYGVPLKPQQGVDETDEDYAQKLSNWQSHVDVVQKRMVIEAKLAKPDLVKMKSELKLPDVQRNFEPEAQTQEELEMMQRARQTYEQTLNSEFQSFNGFNVSVKDEDVEIPISFNVAEDERLAMKEVLSDFDSESYFDNRWFTEDGKPKVQQVMSDIYLLENYGKILQKVANEAASQRLVAHLKKSGNYTINQTIPQGKTDITVNPLDALADAVWSTP